MKFLIQKITDPGKERPVKDVPVIVIYLLAFALTAQLILQIYNPAIKPEVKSLPEAPSVNMLKLMSLAEPVAIARMSMLWLQAFDNQPGVSIPFRNLDYDRVAGWLNLVLELDYRTQYPLLAASRIYSEVPDDNRKRMMLEFVYEKFFEYPDQRWPALAHAVYVAKHRLNDLPLALKYAAALAKHVTPGKAPFWVRQMNIYVLEDMNEIESAKILLGGLIESGEIRDEHELRFLQDRLEKLEAIKRDQPE